MSAGSFPLSCVRAVCGGHRVPASQQPNSSTSANSAAVVSYPTQTVTFKLLVANATGEPAVLETRTYPVAKCELNADCMHDGVCWQGSCQCAFGYSGAFCNQAATNVAGLQTMVLCAFFS